MFTDCLLTLPVPSAPALTRRVAYRQWGDKNNPRVVVCLHGLSRNGRDFDRLAEVLSSRYCVLCPDMAGRGASSWLDNKNDYNYFTYISDMLALLTTLGISSVDWVGTSMGGIIGMMIAAQHKLLIRRLVINDIGSSVSAVGLRRILGFVGAKSHYATYEEAMAALRYYLTPFGIHSEQDWQFMFSISFMKQPSGGYSFLYDPDITKPFRDLALKDGVIADIDLSALWLSIACPVLILRGAESDILTRQTAEFMLKRALPTQLAEFAGVGHAPPLLTPDQIGAVTDWLA